MTAAKEKGPRNARPPQEDLSHRMAQEVIAPVKKRSAVTIVPVASTVIPLDIGSPPFFTLPMGRRVAEDESVFKQASAFDG